MERNPYVLLGVPYGASRDEATLAFTKRAKKLRRQPDGASALTDLTWALNQITDVVRDPSLLIDVYRVPADHDLIQRAEVGVLNPAPQPLPRATGESAAVAQRLVEAAALEGVAVIYRHLATRVPIPPR